VRVTLEAHLASRQVARVVHGPIIGLSLVVVLDSHPPRASVVTGRLITTGLSVGLAALLH
jgi:hypothetical protein